ncbi:MAG: CPBP family glutamic-type intramembrane protease [bacterium]
MSVVERAKSALQEVKDDWTTNGGVNTTIDARSMGVLLLTSVLLTLFYYYGRPQVFRGSFEAWFVDLLGLGKSNLRGVLSYWYWAASSAVLRVLVPLACIIFWFKESPRDFGYRIWEKGHLKIYGVFYLAILPVLILMSFSPSYQKKYPFWDHAGDSLAHFVLYEIPYMFQFLSLEAFFRGFFIFALFKRFGYYSVVIMTIPYCMIHFGKPITETLGAIVAGLLLGYLALKSKSWLPGAMLHCGVGLTMDIAVLLHRP